MKNKIGEYRGFEAYEECSKCNPQLYPHLKDNMKLVNEKYPGLPRKANRIRYRRVKGLCERCGMDKHDGTCEENYDIVDRRISGI
jgi:hypothetical protein